MTPACCRIPKAAIPAGLLLALTLACGVKCGHDQTPNPDLKLMLRCKGHSCFSPALSPSGRQIYYLDDTVSRHGTIPTYELRGGIRVHCIDRGTERSVAEGSFFALALSHDGARLAAASKDLIYARDSSLFVLSDTLGSDVESLYVSHPGETWYVWDIAFSSSSERLVFSMWKEPPDDTTRFYAISLDSSGALALVAKTPWLRTGFDIFDHDSLYADSVARGYPRVNPVSQRWALFAKQGEFSSYWVLHDRMLDATYPLEPGTTPYPGGYLEWPVWLPGGEGVVFAAGPREDGTAQPGPLELWILTNVPLASGDRY